MIPSLDTPVRYLDAIGPKREELFKKMGIRTVEDVLYHFPLRYEDRTRIVRVAELVPGEPASVRTKIIAVKGRRSRRRGFDILEVEAIDDSGCLTAVWFNQPYLMRYFIVGEEFIFYGRAQLYKDRLQMQAPDFERIAEDEEGVESQRIIPVYPLTEGVTQSFFRKTVKAALDRCIHQLREVLPYDVRSRRGLANIAKSLRHIHFPESQEARFEAYRRLAFEEFFLLQIPSVLKKLRRRMEQGIAFDINPAFIERFEKRLSFTLTDAQRKAIAEIAEDMRASRPMHRLLEGEVGSGKTVVAIFAAWAAAEGGYQAALMVPTEILARQHYGKLKALLSTFRPQSTPRRYLGQAVRSPRSSIQLGLLTGGLEKKEKQEVLEKIQRGEVDIVIGTHVLIREDVAFRRLGLVVVDEQHRFGVSQRALLSQKSANPHVLIMTATPIPRTLSMTLYGDLDISVINELPSGRKKTSTFSFGLDSRREAYDFLKKQVKDGGRAYVVCPLIEECADAGGTSAKKVFRELSQDMLEGLRLGLIHGRLKKEEQEAVLGCFRQGEIDILVTTSLLEVGVDVPEATVVLIDGAERFGLSQLHQMRGRVGRGDKESFCLLVSASAEGDSDGRLRLFAECSDGFRIAEEDLKLRGPGEFFGERQHGLAGVKIADPLRQMHILKAAREEAVRLVNDDPRLQKRQNQELRRRIHRRFPEFEKFMMVG